MPDELSPETRVKEWKQTRLPVEGIAENIIRFLNQDLGYNPIPMGVAVRGLPAAQALLRKTVKEVADREGIDFAVAYIKSKYPKLFSLVKGVEVLPATSSLKSGGGYDVSKNIIKSVPSSSPYLTPLENTIDTIQTIAHELVHARQLRKDPQAFINYIPPEQDFVAYHKQPVEVFARRGADTAEKTFREVYRFLLKLRSLP